MGENIGKEAVLQRGGRETAGEREMRVRGMDKAFVEIA